jgi:hypothetical protein
MLHLSIINKPEQRGSLLKKTSNLLFADLFKHRIRDLLQGRNKDLKSIPVASNIGLPYTRTSCGHRISIFAALGLAVHLLRDGRQVIQIQAKNSKDPYHKDITRRAMKETRTGNTASIQYCGSGSGAFLTPGSGSEISFFPDPI